MRGVLSLFLLFMLNEVAAQKEGRLISRMVEDSASHSVLEDATVSLFRTDKAELIVLKRNGRQGFQFGGLKAGDYLIISAHIGCQSDSIHVTGIHFIISDEACGISFA
jgi:hypothetical protein